MIQGYAERLVSNITESEEDKNFYCDVIIKEADKMNKLVKDLLNLSLIESGYFHIEKIEFYIKSLIEFVLNKYKSTFSDNNIQLQIELGENCIVYGGYGLGLSIVKAISELHNSSYGVENIEDGVNFWFEVNKVNLD